MNDPQLTSVQPSAAVSGRSSAVEANALLRLLQSLPQSITEGQKLQAEVISSRQSGQVFDVLLKMALPNGSFSTLPAQTTHALTPGQTLSLIALGQNAFNLTQLSQSSSAALTRLDLSKVPLNSLLQAKVIQLQAQPQGHFRATALLTNTSLAGQTLLIDTPKALAINSVLTAKVLNTGQLQFIPTSTPMQRLSALQALPQQFQQQLGLSAALGKILAAPNLAKSDQATVQQLFNSMPDISKKLSTAQLAELVRNSGTQLEQRLLADSPISTQADLKANLLRLIGQLLPQQAGSNPLFGNAQAAMLAQTLPQLLREAGGFQTKQIREQAMRFPLASRMLEKLDNPNDLGALLRIAAAAISRLQTHQLASLAQTYTAADGTQVNTWQLEIPMRNQDSVVGLQVKFQEEQPSKEKEHNVAPFWRLELSFELEPLGPLHAQVNLRNNTELTSKLWAEREHTAQLVNRELHVLRDKLLAAGLDIRELDCQIGIPPSAPKAVLEQRWIDDLA